MNAQLVNDTRLFDQICELLDESPYEYDSVEEEEVLRIPMEGGSGSKWTLYLRIMPRRRQCVVYSKPNFTVPEERRLLMAEFITRANFGIVVGNFELDMSDGEIRFKTSFDSGGEEVPESIIVSTIEGNIAHMDKYIDILEKNANGTSKEDVPHPQDETP